MVDPFFIIRMILLLSSSIYLIQEYRVFRYQTILLLLIAVIFFTLHEIFIFTLDDSQSDNLVNLRIASVVVFTILSALLALLLFFESFNHTSVLTSKNTILMIIGTAIESIFFTGSIYLSIIDQENPGLLEDEALLFENLTVESAITLVVILTLIFSFFFTLYLIFRVWRKLTEFQKNTENKDLKNNLRLLKLSMILMTIGPIFSPQNGDIISQFLSFLSIIGIGLLMVVFHRTGIFLLQGDSLRRVIIIDEAGIPTYSYLFKSFKSESIEQKDAQEILFSGALKSISVLLSEFTGYNREVKQIALDNLVLSVRNIDGSAVVLFTDHFTNFYYEAFNSFVDAISELIRNRNSKQIFNINEIKISNKLLEKSFRYKLPVDF